MSRRLRREGWRHSPLAGEAFQGDVFNLPLALPERIDGAPIKGAASPDVAAPVRQPEAPPYLTTPPEGRQA